MKKASVRCWLICGWSRKLSQELEVTLHPAHHPLHRQVQTKKAQGRSLRENSESSSNTRLNRILHQHMVMASKLVTGRFCVMASEAPLTILELQGLSLTDGGGEHFVSQMILISFFAFIQKGCSNYLS